MFSRLFHKEPEVGVIVVERPPEGSTNHRTNPNQLGVTLQPEYHNNQLNNLSFQEVEDSWNYLKLADTPQIVEGKNLTSKSDITSYLDGIGFKLSNDHVGDSFSDSKIHSIVRNLSKEVNLESFKYEFDLERQVLRS